MATSDSTSDDCGVYLILGGAAALFLLAPHLSLQATSGKSGTFAAVAAGVFLLVSVLAPFLPKVGAVIGFQWTIYFLWVIGYFTWVGDGITAMTTWSDPDAGADGFILSLLLLIPLILAMALVYLVIPGIIGIAGGLIVNLPALLAWDAMAHQSVPGGFPIHADHFAAL